jgi:hypothetical protein
VRIRYHAPPGSRSLKSAFGSVELTQPGFPTNDASSGDKGKTDDKGKPDEKASKVTGVPVARFTRTLYLPENACYTDFDTDMTTHFERGGVFEGARELVFGHLREKSDADAAHAAVDQIKAMAGSMAQGAYVPLNIPQVTDPAKAARLFEKLDGNARLSVSYVSWTSLYVVGFLCLAFVIALGGWLEMRKLVRPVTYFAASAGTIVLLAVLASRSVEPFLTTALMGSGGLAVFWLGRGVWRELTVEAHRRRLESLAKQAEIAKVRAQAAEIEAKSAAAKPPVPPVPPVAPVAPEKAPIQPDDRAAASKIAPPDEKKGG